MLEVGGWRLEIGGGLLATRNSKLFYPGHHQGVHVLAAPERELALAAFFLEAILAIEGDSAGIVRVDLQLDVHQVEIVVRQVDAGSPCVRAPDPRTATGSAWFAT